MARPYAEFVADLERLRIKKKARTIAQKHGATLEQLCESRKFLHIAEARADLMMLIRERFRMSYPAIAQFFGLKDHGTVLISIRRAKARRAAAVNLE